MSDNAEIKKQVMDFASDLDFPTTPNEPGAETPPEVPPTSVEQPSVQTPPSPQTEAQTPSVETPPAAAPPSQQTSPQVPQVEAPQQQVVEPQVQTTVQQPQVQTPQAQSPVQETNEQRLARENDELRKMLNELAMGQMGGQPQTSVQAPVAQGVQPQAQAQVQTQVPTEQDLGFNPNQVVNFLQNDVQFDEVVKDYKNMNALLTAVRNTTVEHVLRILPKATINLVKQHSTLQQATTEFYRLNEDLVPYRPFVGFVTQKVASEHPDWTLEAILVETEKRSREQLHLMKGQSSSVQPPNTQPQAQTPGRTAGANPGFVPSGPSGRRGSVSAPQAGSMAAQVADLLT